MKVNTLGVIITLLALGMSACATNHNTDKRGDRHEKITLREVMQGVCQNKSIDTSKGVLGFMEKDANGFLVNRRQCIVVISGANYAGPFMSFINVRSGLSVKETLKLAAEKTGRVDGDVFLPVEHYSGGTFTIQKAENDREPVSILIRNLDPAIGRQVVNAGDVLFVGGFDEYDLLSG